MEQPQSKVNYKRLAWEGEPAYGKHLMIHLGGCSDAILDLETIRNFIVDLVPAINMRAFGSCHAHRFGEGQEAGISAFQLIYTSHISVHTNDAAREAYFDIFSCKSFEDDTILDALRETFGPEQVDHLCVFRV